MIISKIGGVVKHMHPVGFLFPVLRFLCNLLCSSLTQQCSHPGSIKQYICFSEESATQLTQQSCLMFKYKVEYTKGISLQGSVLDTFFPKLFKQSVLQPVLWRLGVRGSVCQMAQRAGRPAHVALQRRSGWQEGGERRWGLLSLQSLCSAQLECLVM